MVKRTLRKVLRRVWAVMIFLAQRVGTFYLILLLLSPFVVNYDKVRAKALNFIKPPSYEYLVDFAEGREPFNEKKMRRYTNYYQRIADYAPHRADAQAILGSCYYSLGKKEKAIQHYASAVELDPTVFLFHYNLGLIYFQYGQFEGAAKLFHNALATQPDQCLKFIIVSKIFYPLMKIFTTDVTKMPPRLESIYQNCYELLVRSYYQQRDHESVLRYATEALALGHKGADTFYYYAGVAAYELQEYPLALKYLDECLKENQDYLEAIYYRGMIFQALGQQQKAQEAFASVLTLKDSQESDEIRNAAQRHEDQEEFMKLRLRLF